KFLFPAESVFGSIEVKSNLTLSELDLACQNVASIKRLKRVRADTLDLLPHLRVELGPTLAGGGDFRNPYLGVVFGYRGAPPQSVATELSVRAQSLGGEKEKLPNFVFVVEPGYMIMRCQQNGAPAPPGSDFATFGFLPVGSDTLPLFFLTLNICLGSLR